MYTPVASDNVHTYVHFSHPLHWNSHSKDSRLYSCNILCCLNCVHSSYRQSSLVQSQKEVTDIREKSEVAAKQFEEERGRMKEEIIHLEERLEKQQQESKVRMCTQRLARVPHTVAKFELSPGPWVVKNNAS